MYKCAIIGVGGGRAHGLAEAYAHIKRGRLVAVSTRRKDKLDEFAAKFKVGQCYTDYRKMLRQEQPDLVHVNTPPDVRLEVFEAAEAAGVPAVIVEKPLAIQAEDFLAIKAFAEGAKVRIAINHQLHFHPRRQMLQRLVADGGIGQVRFIEASARLNLAYQGTHALQAVGAFNLGGKPAAVFGQVSGAEGLVDTPRKHFAPDQCVAALEYDNGIGALLQCGTNAPAVLNSDKLHLHKQVAVYGTQGYVHWTMWSWALHSQGRSQGGEHQYPEEDILGQAAMTEAMFDWLEDQARVHPLNLNSALSDFNIILGIYTSGLRRCRVSLPIAPDMGLVDALRQCLAG